MVQEIAKKLIHMGKKEEAQDLYFIPRKEEYQVFMRVGDERRFVQSFPFEEMTAIISHFKFVAGMNVGEKRRSQLGSCDYPPLNYQIKNPPFGGLSLKTKLSFIQFY